MASPELSRRVERVVGYPPLSELSDVQRREFREALLEANAFEDLSGRWRAAILEAEVNRPKLRVEVWDEGPGERPLGTAMARAVLAGAAAAVAVVVVVVGVVRSEDGADRQSRPAGGPSEEPVVARHAVTEEGVPFSFRVPPTDPAWERFSSISTAKSAGGPISLNKSIVGPQGAEAIIFWTSFPDGDYADPCARLLSPPVGSSAADLAAAVSTAPGTELVRGPSNVTLGGRPAQHVALTVRENVGCDPGFFYSWRDVNGGALWRTTGAGSTIKVWIVDVDGTRLFIEAETTNQAPGGLKQEVEKIVESIRFD